MSELAPCPCGLTPDELIITAGHWNKWAYVSGDCCGEWNIEFGTGYEQLDSEACRDSAINAWNVVCRTSVKG